MQKIEYSYDITEPLTIVNVLQKITRRINLNGQDVVIVPEQIYDHVIECLLGLAKNKTSEGI